MFSNFSLRSRFNRVIALRLRISLWLIAVGIALAPTARAAGTTALDPEANGNVYAVLVQSDGKVVIGGNFTTVSPAGETRAIGRNRLARFNADGSIDLSFDPNLDGDVYALQLQPDGKILVGGKFSNVQPNGASTAVSRSGMVRLNTDGTVDTAFNPQPQGAPASQAQVYAIALQSDGKILIGGGFTSVQPNGGAQVSRLHLARLASDGSLDTTFDPQPNNIVFSFALQPDGKILVGGGFTQLQPKGGDTVSRGRLARLNTDGSVDSNFNVYLDNRLLAIAVHADGSILLGGEFQTVLGVGDTSATSRFALARVSTNGVLDNNFKPTPNASVSALAYLSDGHILVGGNFTSVTPFGTTITRNHLARLDPDGSPDPDFSPSPNASVSAIRVQSDGRIVIGGYFSRVVSSDSGLSFQRNHVARLQRDGTVDAEFGSAANGSVAVLTKQSDGKLLVGGSFASVAGLTRHYLARVNTDGSVDATFQPVLDGHVSTVAVQSDGKILVGGDFTHINDTARTGLARLNADGSLDTSFKPAPSASVYSVVLQSDGKILIGGAFTSLAPNDATTATTRNYIARLNTDGTVDTSYNPNASAAVYVMVLQSDGNLLVGGNFTTIGGSSRAYIARLNSSGSADSGFNPTANSTVYSIALTSDSKILVGGAFSAFKPNSGTTTVRNYIARLASNGTVDTSFAPSVDSPVFAVASLSSGNVLLGGAFSAIQPIAGGAWTGAERFALLKSDGNLVGSSGANDEVHAFLANSDGTFWIGGAFTTLFASDGTPYLAQAHFARVKADGSPDTSFAVSSASSGAYVGALGLQSGGQIIIGGSFSKISGGNTDNLARLSASGDADTSFTTSTDQPVHAILVQPAAASETIRGNTFAWLETNGHFRSSFAYNDVAKLSGTVTTVLIQSDGNVLVGGTFVSSDGDTGKNLVRFNSNGTLDTAFVPRPNDNVQVIVAESGGTYLVGGSFTEIGGVTRNHLARMNADGSIDSSFDPNLSDVVNTILVQSDGKILVGGNFTTIQPNAAASTTSVGYIVRLNADGTQDTTFKPVFNAAVSGLALDGDHIVVSGSFTTVQPTSATTTTARLYMARLNSDGTLDTAFYPTANGSVTSLVRQSDGKLLVAGSFSTFQPNGATASTARTFLARLNADGTVDTAFNPVPDGSVYRIKVASDGSIYLAGVFTSVRSNPSSTAVTRHRLARLAADGTVDLGFDPNANGGAYAIDIASDGSLVVGGVFTQLAPDATIVVGGSFTQIGNATLPYLARLNADSNPDTSFQLNPNGAVRALALRNNGDYYAAGDFTQIAGASRAHLARFSRDGTLAADFSPSTDGAVQALLVQPDGNVLVGGSFSKLNGASRANLGRVTSSGGTDSSFSPAVDGTVSAIQLQRDGKIVIAGSFRNVGGASRAGLARLNADGSVDSAFNPAPDGTVTSISLQSDGRMIIGGSFQKIAGVTQPNLARLNLDGSFDSTVRPVIDGAVYTVAIQDDGHAVMGGAFGSVDSRTRLLVARLASSDAQTRQMAVTSDRSQVLFARTGASPVLTAVTFAWSTNGNTWTELGAATPSTVADVWAWYGSAGALPALTNYYIRATGIETVSRNTSSSVVEYVWQFYGSTPVGPNAEIAASSSSVLASFTSGSSSNGTSSSSGSSSSSSSSSSSGASGSSSSTTSTDSPGLVNLSTRIQMQAGETVITGFIISGTDPKDVLVRAVGPTLTNYGITNPVTSPTLEVYNGSGTRLLTGQRWDADPSFATLFASTGIFPLKAGSNDQVARATLPPGGYTLLVKNTDGTEGVLLTEIYGLDSNSTSQFFNLSARATSGSGENVMIGGFIVGGNSTKTLLIRGMGPALKKYGVTGTLPDPLLRIYNGAGTLIAANDNWIPADITPLTAQMGVTPLESGSTDAALVLNLAPGAYTATISDVNGTTGIGMIEIFEVK